MSHKFFFLHRLKINHITGNRYICACSWAWCGCKHYRLIPLLTHLIFWRTITVPNTASYIRGWIQMVLAPNDLFSWNNKYNKYNEYNIADTFTCIFLAMHTNLICACWHFEAMTGSSSLTSCRLLILSRLLSSLIWAQLTLPVPALGIWSPLPQNGAPIHRVRAHSLTGIHNNNIKARKLCNLIKCQFFLSVAFCLVLYFRYAE